MTPAGPVPRRRAVVLLSGGLDSATALAEAGTAGFECYALTIDYGQRHRIELEAARAVSAALGVREHKILVVDLREFGGSALTTELPIPTGRAPSDMTDIPPTYVPARNTVFLSLALAWAETLGAHDLFIGVNALDYSVAGSTRIWIRTPRWARAMSIAEVVALPPDEYETVAVDRDTLEIGWRRVTQRVRHDATSRRCFRVRLERGQEIEITEDHSLFTIDPSGAQIIPVKGCQIAPGMPIAVPYDLSEIAHAWRTDTPALSLDNLALPLRVPVTDDFLYIVGLWLAEGGKSLDSRTSSLAFSIGGISGAVDAVRRVFAPYGVAVRANGNGWDYIVQSSVFAAAFESWGLFGTAKHGEKQVPVFYWTLSQRQRRLIVAGIWDGDGSRAVNGEAILAQKSHSLLRDVEETLLLDGIFPSSRHGRNGQRFLVLNRAKDFRRFGELYPLQHEQKRASYIERGRVAGKDVPTLTRMARSKLGFLRVIDVDETAVRDMYDLAVENAENFVANGVLAHNSGYPDCRPEYIDAFERMANLATKAGVEGTARFRVHAPLLRFSKADIVRRAEQLGIDPRLTWSCYAPVQNRPCGACDACVLRRKGFLEAGRNDPLIAS